MRKLVKESVLYENKNDIFVILGNNNTMLPPKEHRPFQECYENALLEYKEWKKDGYNVKYILGEIYSQEDPYPIQHAWLLLNNKIIDSTLFLKTGDIHGETIPAIEHAQVAYSYKGPMEKQTYYMGMEINEEELSDSLKKGERNVDMPEVDIDFWKELRNSNEYIQARNEIKELGIPNRKISEEKLKRIKQYAEKTS